MNSISEPTPTPPPPAFKRGPSHGKLIAGVAGAIAARTAVPTWIVRGAFVAATLFFGAGAIAYVVGWIAIPAEEDDERSRDIFRSLVIAGLTLLGMVVAFALAALSGALSAFGFGAVVVAALIALLMVTALAWPKLKPLPAIVLALALALPMVAVAAAGVDLDRNLSGVFAEPATARSIPTDGYATGVGNVFVDLRQTVLPRGSETRVPIRSGEGLVVVALPHSRCVKVRLTHRRSLFSSLAQEMPGDYGRNLPQEQYRDLQAMEQAPPPEDEYFGYELLGHTNLFDRTEYGRRAALVERRGPADAPTVVVEAESLDSTVFVRDYPDFIGPLDDPAWPYSGTIAPPASPGDLRWAWRIEKIDSSKAVAARWRYWQKRMAAHNAMLKRLAAGPCASEAANGD